MCLGAWLHGSYLDLEDIGGWSGLLWSLDYGRCGEWDWIGTLCVAFMVIYQQTEGARRITKSATSSEERQLSAVMFGPLDWDVKLVDGEGAVITSGITSISVCIKASHDFEGPAFFLAAGDVADTELVDSVLLRALLDGRREATLWVNIRWQLGSSPVEYGAPSAIKIFNSPHQPTEVGHDPAGNPFYEALKAALQAGSNMTLTPNDVAKTITLASSGSGGGSPAWADITGKPSTFPPDSHTHSIYVRGTLSGDGSKIEVFSADGLTSLGFIQLTTT